MILGRFSPIHAFVLLGAVLLFSLEPLVGRMLLPQFGGAFHVWTTALMFFQGALFVAYLYAHLAAEKLGRWHLAVVAIPLLLLPPSVGAGAPESADSWAIIARLVVHVALPFGVLATTSVVAQRWWAATGRDPYSLYAVSNAGSLGALLLYAIGIEPLFGVTSQRWGWTVIYVVYVGLAVLAWRARGKANAAPSEGDALEESALQPDAGALVYWGFLAAAPSAFLMGVTNLIALEAGNVPLVWVTPLALYLGSFVVAFADPKEGEESRVPGVVRRLWPHVAAVGIFFFSGGDAGGGWFDVLVHLSVLTVVALAAHAELHRVRPPSRHLTLYYLVIALGGWLGGAFVALVAPVAFDHLVEYPIALALLGFTMVIGRRTELRAWLRTGPKLALIVSAALLGVIVWKIGSAAYEQGAVTTLEVRRSFYGIYRVTRTLRGGGAVRDLISGNTRHGRQREGDQTPLSYYHPEGPLGDALAVLRPTRIGAVGLGVGAAAGHLDRTQRLRFYEIDPAVVDLARRHFSYLSHSRGEVDVVVGDARVSLRRERVNGEPPYDLLFIDAFAGDAIPTHLLTVEAIELYFDRVRVGGVVLFHVSNRFYDIRPVLRANAEHIGLAGIHVARTAPLALDQDPSQYVALAREEAVLLPFVEEHGWTPISETPALADGQVWTDDHVNPLGALMW